MEKQEKFWLPRRLRHEYQERLDEACRLDTGDGKIIVRVLGAIARDIGVIAVTKHSGLERTSFYRSFSGKSDPRIGTICRIIRGLGLRAEIR